MEIGCYNNHMVIISTYALNIPSEGTATAEVLSAHVVTFEGYCRMLNIGLCYTQNC